ncbi:prephenate dehydratase [Parvularcula dongshanensis]|uniref:prephenate dehydratase n=1 Tax=Parvularcula dongshanensis TaxID=1173995 RepID=A0A840HYM5_9PROT|nr:prephenate dehydratase [Parvularcula dongshanensis]MBB4657946.1 prephenate dehydratase [Parvularcula dongshanensis]
MAKIAYQGEPGAFSDEACRTYAPDFAPMPCPTFDAVFRAVAEGRAARAMVPVENAIAGRVDDVYRLLPDAGMAILDEHFLPIHMQLMALPDADEDALTTVRSHPMALSQCRGVIARRGLIAEVAPDTAGAAHALSSRPEPNVAVIAPRAAAEAYGLRIVERDVQDIERNVTRFLTLAPEAQAVWPDLLSGPVLTSLVFRVRNIPAALYKALGGCATNAVNMIKLESYQEDSSFLATRFQAEIEGHPDDPPVRRALDELGYFSSEVKLLGVFPADPYRAKLTRS